VASRVVPAVPHRMVRLVTALILVLGAYRLWMLIAKDTITQAWRTRLLGYDDNGARNRWPKPRRRLAEFVHCPWCAGFWISLAVAAAYWEWPHATRLALAPFAISAALALISVCFDRLVLDRSGS
jgi:hypothetical protein